MVGNGQVFSTLNGARLSISKTGSTVVLNANTPGNGAGAGAKLQTFDLVATNGVIHVGNRALQPITDATVTGKMGITVNYGVTPPTATVAAAATNYNIIANALAVTGVAFIIQPNKSPLPDYTVFAPHDTDFLAYLTSLNGAIVTEADAITFVKGLN